MTEEDRQIVISMDALYVQLSQVSEPSSLPLQEMREKLAGILQRCYEMNAANFPADLLHDWNGEYLSGKPIAR
jgi:hypothetical protein